MTDLEDLQRRVAVLEIMADVIKADAVRLGIDEALKAPWRVKKSNLR
jgi:hypothetical protein